MQIAQQQAVLQVHLIDNDCLVNRLVDIVGKYLDGDLEEIPTLAKEAREYVEDNALMTLDELIENWEKLCVM